MCQCTINQEINKSEKKFRLADFFDTHWDNYCQAPMRYIEPEQLRAVNALRVCRTARLGVDIYVCPDCGEESRVYHSCKNRFCPTCSWKDTIAWADRIKNKMLKVKHRHIVCTLPHRLHPLLKRNRNLMSSLMRASAGTFTDWMENRYGIKIGIIAVLHTYGEKKNYHPHVHMIVSWGGVSVRKDILKEIKSEFVNYKFLQKKFRCKFESELIEFFDQGQLEHDFANRRLFMNYLKEVNQQDWQLHLEPAIETPSEVIRYIGRYSKRACISEYKITKMEGDHISFQYKDYKDRDERGKARVKELTLHYRQFFPRLLQHVPPAYFRIVRYYGLYSNHGHIDPSYLYQTGKEVLRVATDVNCCETCQVRKVYVHTYFDPRTIREIRGRKSDVVKTKWKDVA
jgi:hypothetical protein